MIPMIVATPVTLFPYFVVAFCAIFTSRFIARKWHKSDRRRQLQRQIAIALLVQVSRIRFVPARRGCQTLPLCRIYGTPGPYGGRKYGTKYGIVRCGGGKYGTETVRLRKTPYFTPYRVVFSVNGA